MIAESIYSDFLGTLMIGSPKVDPIGVESGSPALDSKNLFKKIDLTTISRHNSDSEKSPGKNIGSPKVWGFQTPRSKSLQEDKIAFPVKLIKTLKIEEKEVIIIRPLKVENFSSTINDLNCIDLFKRSMTNILTHLQQRCEALKFGESFKTVGDESCPGNYVLGQFVNYQLMICLNYFFNYKRRQEFENIWNILPNILNHDKESFARIDNVCVDKKDLKFHYFVCEMICEKRMNFIMKTIFETNLSNYYEEEAMVFDEFDRVTILKLFSLLEKQPFDIILHSHKELEKIKE
jgi:hypothetical protein